MWIHPYRLVAKAALNSKSPQKQRLGFFIKDSNYSEQANPVSDLQQYSDFLHWPELDDPELKVLKPFLMKQAQNEMNNRFSFKKEDLTPVKSNGLINLFSNDLGETLERHQEAGFEIIKLKMGRDFVSEFKFLMKMNLSHFLLRVDLNEKFNFKESKEILEMLKKIPNLEYVEDPTPYHDYYWSVLQTIAPLALDKFNKFTNSKPPKNFQFRIVKPSREFVLEDLIKLTYDNKKIVLTNMMDNVVGAWKLYFYYCELKKRIPYHLCVPGFYTHLLYDNYEHSNLLSFTGAEWRYDEQKLQTLLQVLKKLNWLELKYTDHMGLDSLLSEQDPN